MNQLHQDLQESFPWYRKWHESRNYKALHYVILIIALAITGAIIASSVRVNAAPTTYYVSTNGNDTNPGTQSAPWKTVVKACNTVTNSGDTIHIGTGTFTGTQQCNLSPGVNLEGEGKNNTIVKITITGNLNSATSTAAINMESPNGTNGNQSISNLTLDGGNGTTGNASGTWIGVYNQGRSNVSIHDTIIKNFHFYGAVFQGNTLDGQTAHTWTDGPYATGNRFYNNDASNCAGVLAEIQGGSGCLGLGWQDGMEIYNNSIINTARLLGKNGWPIKFWSNGYLKGLKIHDNTLVRSPYNSPQVFGGTGEWDFAIEFFNVQGLELANNYIQGSVDVNYTYKGTYPYGIWAHHNTLNHATQNPNPESGFILEFKAEHVLIENNTFNNKFVGVSYNTRGVNNNGGENTYACNYGGSTGGCSGIINNVIRNNVFSNLYSGNGATGGIITQSEATNDVQMDGMHIYNNVFSSKTGNTGTYNGIDFGGMGGGASVKNVYIRNNIFQNFRSNPIVKQSGGTQSNIQITNNDFYNNTPNDVSWTGATQANNQTINPLFVSGTDFHLQATSPLIDDGFTPLALPSYAPAVPFNGSAPDLGAYETGASAPDTTPPTVSSVSPTSGSTGVAITVNPTAVFSEALNASTVTSASAYIMQGSTAVQAAVTYSNNSVVLAPTASLAPNTAYTVTLTTAITDLAGNHLAGNYNFSFTTAAAPNIPPTVNAGPDQTINLPANSVTMSGSASDSDGTIATHTWSKFSGPSAFTITDPASYTTTITGLSVGTYVFRLSVVDNNGAPASDDVNVIVKDVTAPTVSLTAPASGTVSGTVAVSANASDNVAVDHVDFHIDGVYTTTIGTDATSPYSINWNSTTVPNGAHTITARAYDTSNNFTTSSSVSVTVTNSPGGGGETIPPTVSISSPTAGSTVNGSVVITASAGDASGVAQVKFYRGTTLIGSDTCGTGPTCNAPGTYNFAVTWNTTGLSGPYSLTAVAYDTNGNVTTSPAVSVTVGVVNPPNGTYTTWNPSDKSSRVSLSNGNLTASRNNGVGVVRAGVGKSSGKWYWEVKLNTAGDQFIGVATVSANLSAVLGSNRNGWSMVMDDGVKFNRGNQGYYGTAGSNGDVVGIALDMDAKKITFYKKANGSSTCTNYGTAFSNLVGPVYPAWGSQYQNAQGTANFGASPFACPVPAGFNPGVTQ